MILIVGGRYGSERSGKSNKDDADFYIRYDSITREEFRAAAENGVPLYILIERAVYAEYRTFLKNRDSTDISYAHVDSVNIFRMIDEILSLPQNNPFFPFDRFHEIEAWLREQWAGLFQDLLKRMTSQEHLASLAAQVTQLHETNQTLKRYIESQRCGKLSGFFDAEWGLGGRQLNAEKTESTGFESVSKRVGITT
ncbi:MAG: hypothetical protein ACI8UO_006518, partial [Verrucomicrobiales bacterium]